MELYTDWKSLRAINLANVMSELYFDTTFLEDTYEEGESKCLVSRLSLKPHISVITSNH